MTTLPRLAAHCLPFALAAPSAYAAQEPAMLSQPDPMLADPLLVGPLPLILMEPDPPLPDGVRAMIDAAFASGEDSDVEAVIRLARQTNPGSLGEISALISYYRSANPAVTPPDPVRDMLTVAIASGKDADVEAVAKLAKAARPDDAAEIEARVAAYRGERQRLKDEAAAAARARLAAAKLWENWKGEGQIGGSLSTGNTKSAGLSAGLALARKGIDWTHRLRLQADYQRTNGRTSIDRYLGEFEPQDRLGDRGFVYGLGRWEQDRILGYDSRWNLSGGLGYKLIDSQSIGLSLKGGPAWRRTNFITGASDDELTALAGLDFGWQLSPTLRLTQVASTVVGEANSSTSSLTALNAKLSGKLSARIAYAAQIDSSPPPGVESVDTQTRFTLVYGF